MAMIQTVFTSTDAQPGWIYTNIQMDESRYEDFRRTFGQPVYDHFVQKGIEEGWIIVQDNYRL